MARIFITGSSDGVGSLTAQRLVERGHKVVLHARNLDRSRDAQAACPGSEAVLVADLTSIDEIKQLATDANKLGPFDCVVHNAGVYLGMEKVPGKSGLPSLFTVNTLAPYLLTCLLSPPKRLLFVSSGMHHSGHLRLDDLPRSGYSDSKLHNVMLANAFARRFLHTKSNSADPGWVPTKMGGRSAPDDLNAAVNTFVTVALGEGATDGETGKYFKDSRLDTPAPAAQDVAAQDRLLEELGKITGVAVPMAS